VVWLSFVTDEYTFRVTDLDLVAERLRTARRVAALTGAGVSAASGVPTFRGAGKTWSARSGAGTPGPREHSAPGGVQGAPPWEKVRAETLATPEAFEHDPKLVWEWYDWRRQMIAGVSPNPAHDVLARWTLEREGFTLITQNVDGLHERAGAVRLIRLHGSIWHVRCWRACPAGREDWRDDAVPQPRLPPSCPHCGGFVRPGVVWFGEPLDPGVMRAAAAAAAACDVFLSIGTSAVVYPAAGLISQARRGGAFTVEINTDVTDASTLVDVSLRAPAAETLQRLAGILSS
jgi:NAD-dependent deacetylase